MDILISLLVAVIIGAIIFYLVKTYCPEPPRTIVLWILAAIAIIYLLGLLFGVSPGFSLKR